jgi:exosome complex component RRP4
MGKVLIEERQLVVPGQELAEGMDHLPGNGAFREDDKIYSSKVGLAHVDNRLLKVIPLGGKYLPKEGDVIIGKVIEIGLFGWRIDFGWSFFATLPLKEGSREYIPNGADLSQYYKIGDYVACKITRVVGSKVIDVSAKYPGTKRLTNGRLISVKPTRVPRIIGKQGSMVSLVKEKTGVFIIVGQNGNVWIFGGEPEGQLKAIEAIRLIEKEAHEGGLTEKVSAFLDKGSKVEKKETKKTEKKTTAKKEEKKVKKEKK